MDLGLRGPGRLRPSSGPAEPGDPTSNPESKRLVRGSCQALISLTFKGNHLPSHRHVEGGGLDSARQLHQEVAAAGSPEPGVRAGNLLLSFPTSSTAGSLGLAVTLRPQPHCEHAVGLSACDLRSWRRASSFTQQNGFARFLLPLHSFLPETSLGTRTWFYSPHRTPCFCQASLVLMKGSPWSLPPTPAFRLTWTRVWSRGWCQWTALQGEEPCLLPPGAKGWGHGTQGLAVTLDVVAGLYDRHTLRV